MYHRVGKARQQERERKRGRRGKERMSKRMNNEQRAAVAV